MTKKVAISLPDRTLDRAAAAVKRRKALIDQASAAESFEQMIAELLEKSGATEAEERAAERQAAADFERAGLVPKT